VDGRAIYWTGATGAHLIYGEIYKKWQAAGGESGVMGYPITDEASTPDNVCQFNNFNGGGAIYYTAALGGFLIYGDIYKKWQATGGESGVMGYPITDEASAPDNVCRFNNFSGGGAIYWTAARGAFLIYGDIYKKWIALGGEGSYLGYPVTDETSAGTKGGRYNDFVGGSIYWSPLTGAHDHKGSLSAQLDFDAPSYVFPDGVALGGYSHVTLHSNGNVIFTGHMHDSGAVDYKYAIAWIITDADNSAYSLSNSGEVYRSISRVFGSGSDDSNWTSNASNTTLAQNWRAIVAASSSKSQGSETLDVAGLVGLLFQAVGVAGTIISLV
jgi:uncharacterized protein with LGFP repeats